MHNLKVYISGHRNPDCDSITSAYALAELRRSRGWTNVEAICPGQMPDRVKWVFDHFGVTPPPCKSDVYLRVRDLMSPQVPIISAEMPLIDALRELEASGESSLPVAAKDGSYCGMLSPAKLLSLFIAKDDLTRPTGDAPLNSDPQILQAEDRIHDIKAAVLRSPRNHFPVIDENGKLMGTLLKRAFAETPPYRMILVDHNETDQGIPGLEEIPVIEVVDHHRISFAATPEPIRYTADVVGSTCTLVSKMFRGSGIRPTKSVAGILLAGIVADTLLFQSPTTTDSDTAIAAWLEKISGETAKALMDGMMSVGSALNTLSPENAIDSDRKTYTEVGYHFSLAQIEEPNLALFHSQQATLQAALDRICQTERLDFAALLITDPGRGNSELMFSGAENIRRALPWRRMENGLFSLPGVLSRKKQMLPEILSAIASL